ncbi:TPA: hypothetical protein QDC03_007537 [Burkholderia cepacia]|nr:hypothetical protein [Burkholderia cepacia]HDR9512259.1 hypothetical protein [Burkholderia cepacia]
MVMLRVSLLKYIVWPALAAMLVGCGGADTDLRSDTLVSDAHASDVFPAVGQVWRADFGDFVFDVNFETQSTVTLGAVKGPNIGQTETVSYTATPLREGLFAVSWTDSGGSVVHVEDFQQQLVYAFITPKNGQPLSLQGPFTLCSVGGVSVDSCGATIVNDGNVTLDSQGPSRTAFPPVGQVWRADFGEFAFDLRFETAETLSFTEVKGPEVGRAQTVSYTSTLLRMGLYAVRWTDSGGSVVQVEDFQRGTIKSFITQSDGQTALLQGSLTRVQ